MNKKITDYIYVHGKGSSKKKAVSQALAKIQSEVMRKYHDHMIIRVEPLDVEISNSEEEKYIEKFLFFFFKREKINVSVELKITVSLFLLELCRENRGGWNV
ncbi:uncharacterized protein (TIGR03578 family) [Virgibacillus halotolerans]|uniref:DUF4312 family protein n=1 Tax=Virgibacillus halotolerans TaxID=1071053 RepID=UPI001961FD40|nr:uncharacterized protein (TIGR03578 family) [Virgibacillus halotolerans]